jgi:uncharacterized protein HemX
MVRGFASRPVSTRRILRPERRVSSPSAGFSAFMITHARTTSRDPHVHDPTPRELLSVRVQTVGSGSQGVEGSADTSSTASSGTINALEYAQKVVGVLVGSVTLLGMCAGGLSYVFMTKYEFQQHQEKLQQNQEKLFDQQAKFATELKENQEKLFDRQDKLATELKEDIRRDFAELRHDIVNAIVNPKQAKEFMRVK